ncbi:hypothetical protein I2I11_07560 [Pontibacter sp. 172403-2]|uniref:hypothetical protein n=1 Tax=Pontibacter rufus TaxID=2791028 RepID=UPI0018AF610B|nr:hypothetical protein [Pontibacter sp. 172403-2]MBF9253145.1 hypothetical protein [Pontibacter sp. 172403-2]
MKYLNKLILLPLLVLLLAASSCKKDKAEPQLPAATMEGKNTFGAMVNGKVWTPKGRPNFYESNLSVVYDPGYEAGSLEIKAFRVTENTDDYIFIYMSQLDHEGIYNLDNPKFGTATFWSHCTYEREPEVYRRGKLEITKLDLTNGIIAGKFEFTLAKLGCDTVRVTEGRFDKKLF